MKRFLIAICLFTTIGLYAKNDTTLSRVVTVERDFQPVIKSAGKIQQRPFIIQNEVQFNPVVYSTYSNPLSVDCNIHQLPAAETRFLPQVAPQGIIDGAIGHRNTHFRFGYQIYHKKKMSLNLYANHDAYWGRDALSQSKLGMQVTRHFSKTDLYFGVEGSNEYFTYYGRYFDGDNGLTVHTIIDRMTLDGVPWILLSDQDKRNIWRANAHIGLRSTGNSPLKYRIQTGYAVFTPIEWVIEHQVRTHFDLLWSNNTHGAGVKAYVQNSMCHESDILNQPIKSRHAVRVEPFYEYSDKYIRLHVGMNIDLNVGTGELLSTIKNLSFAPSPNIDFEWRMMDDIFHIYAQAKGTYGIGSLEEYLGYNRYLNFVEGIDFHQPRAYTPVDAQLGFKIRPAKTLLIDIYGGYAYLLRACNMHAELNYDNPGVAYYSLWQDNYQRWKVGATLHYHYRDILEVNLGGNYYFYQQEPIPSMDPDAPYFQEARIKGTNIFDRPNWDAHLRVDAHIDSKWSIYSENYFAGSRMAYVQTYPSGPSAVELKPTISLNIGGQYAINRWLIVYLQLNNYLNRKNDIFYGYQEQGCHFLAGVKWKF